MSERKSGIVKKRGNQLKLSGYYQTSKYSDDINSRRQNALKRLKLTTDENSGLKTEGIGDDGGKNGGTEVVLNSQSTPADVAKTQESPLTPDQRISSPRKRKGSQQLFLNRGKDKQASSTAAPLSAKRALHFVKATRKLDGGGGKLKLFSDADKDQQKIDIETPPEKLKIIENESSSRAASSSSALVLPPLPTIPKVVLPNKKSFTNNNKSSSAGVGGASKTSSMVAGGKSYNLTDLLESGQLKSMLNKTSATTASSSAKNGHGKETAAAAKNTAQLLADISRSNALFKRLNDERDLDRQKELAEEVLADSTRTPPSSPTKQQQQQQGFKSPLKSGVCPAAVSPFKSPSKRREESAHARLGLLTERDLGLALPQSYAMLNSMFKNGDRFVFHLHARSQTVTFPKLQQNVEAVVGKKLSEHRLGQLKSVYPESWLIDLVKNVYQFGPSSSTKRASSTSSSSSSTTASSSRGDTYTLTIKPNLDNDLKLFEPAGGDSYAGDLFKSNAKDDSPMMLLNGTRLVYRQSIFKANLVRLLKQHHQTFLSSLSPPVLLSADESDLLTRWHPKFLSWSGLPDISAAPIPQPPAPRVALSAAAFLTMGTVNSMQKRITEKMEKRLSKSPQKSVTLSLSSSVSLGLSPTKRDIPKALKGLNPKLIQEIRRKEASNARRMLLMDPAEEQRIARLQRIIKYVNSVRSIMMLEKPTATKITSIPRERLAEKLAYSLGMTAQKQAEINGDLSYMCRVISPSVVAASTPSSSSSSSSSSTLSSGSGAKMVRKWLEEIEIPGRGAFVRINLTLPTGPIIDKITEMIGSGAKNTTQTI